MEVLIENIQNKIEVTTKIKELIESAVNQSLKLEQFVMEAEISILLVDNEKITEINKEHREIDSPTDVLSFPIVEMHQGEIIDQTGDYDRENQLLVLGDIVISLEKAKDQAEEYKHSFERELAFLVTHGVFHLLGYDHSDSDEEKLMLSRQEDVLTTMDLKRK